MKKYKDTIFAEYDKVEKQATKDVKEYSDELNKQKPKFTLTFGKSASKDIFDMLDVKGKRCQICDKKLTPNNWAGFIFGKPICKNTICIMDVMMEQQKKYKKVK